MSPPTNYLVIFGAAVRADGSPSGSLRRRVDAALHAAAASQLDCVFMPTGGVGTFPPAESEVMAQILRESGRRDQEILTESRATDTLSSVMLCHQILSQQKFPQHITICTSKYHAPRCKILFSILGYDATLATAVGDRRALGTFKWLVFILKECIATPYDFVLLLVKILRHQVLRVPAGWRQS